jgi:hypothetical protein
MNFLIAVSSCQKDAAAGDHDVIRETWGKVADENGVPYIITIGDPRGIDMPLPHERYVIVPDDWKSLPLKTISNCQWALDRGYDWMFQCFRDTYISIPRLLEECPKLNHQVVGNFYFHNVYEGHPCGGSGYWMHKDFMKLLVESGTGGHIAEDILVGKVMEKHGIVGYHDSRYDHCTMRGGVSLHNSNITNHLWTHYCEYFGTVLGIEEWNADWLRQEQRKELTGKWTEQDEAYMQRLEKIKAEHYRMI